MPKTALSDAALRSLPLPEKGQRDHWDATLKGFGVRVSQGGSKTFVLNIDNSRRTIGRYPILSLAEARAEAKRILAERTLGRVLPKAMTFNQARDLFLAEKKATRREGTYEGHKRFLNLYFSFSGKLSELTHTEVARRLNKIAAPSEKNHAIAAAKTFFTWCAKKRFITDNPTFGLSLQRRASRSRVLEDSEVVAIWRACDDEEANLPAHFRTIVKLLICTGQRRGEIAALRGEYLSLQESTITLPGSLTKNHREHTFPLAAVTVEVLAKITPANGLLFPARGRSTPFNGWGKSKAELDRVSGVLDWTLHDLRRTYATTLAKLGTPIHVVEKLLNHISGTTGGLVGVYNRHLYWDEQVAAVARHDAHLRACLA